MRYTTLVPILTFCAGLGAGWLLRSQPQASAPIAPIRPAAAPVRADNAVTSEVTAAEQPVRVDEQAPAVATAKFRLVEPPENYGRRYSSNPNEIFPSGHNDDLPARNTDPLALERLLDAARIFCQFDAGHGATWNGGDIKPYSASWQGGVISYDLIDLTAGTARMSNDAGATGTRTGETSVRAAATRNGLYFSSFLPTGDLLTVAVLAKLDRMERHLAIMSEHGTSLVDGSSQFYGTCDGV